MTVRFDAIVIGAGQAGPALAARFAAAGKKVAVIERSRFGGTCVNTGCIPTKTLVASAYVAHMARRAAEYGIKLDGPVTVDVARVKARKDAIVKTSRAGVETWMKTLPNCTVYEGHARFQSSRRVMVGDDLLEADHIFIDVGGRANIPELPGVHDVSVLTNTSILELDTLPQHLVIVGGSYVGLEFAQMYGRFGAAVTVIETAARLVPREDPDVSAAIKAILEAEGVTIRLNADCISFRQGPVGPAVEMSCDAGSPVVEGTHVLLAVGRRPNTDDLGLEAAGIATDARGYIRVDDYLRTSAPGVWAVGECNGKGAFTHTAFNDNEIVAANIFDNDPRKVSDRITAYGLYIDPPLGRAGLTETEVRASGRPALVGMRQMTRVGRAVEKGETQGFMKVIVDAESRQILGAAVLGPGGDEAIHGILDVMYAKAAYSVLQRAMHIHPTVSELIPTILGELQPLVNPD